MSNLRLKKIKRPIVWNGGSSFSIFLLFKSLLYDINSVSHNVNIVHEICWNAICIHKKIWNLIKHLPIISSKLYRWIISNNSNWIVDFLFMYIGLHSLLWIQVTTYGSNECLNGFMLWEKWIISKSKMHYTCLNSSLCQVPKTYKMYFSFTNCLKGRFQTR